MGPRERVWGGNQGHQPVTRPEMCHSHTLIPQTSDSAENITVPQSLTGYCYCCIYILHHETLDTLKTPCGKSCIKGCQHTNLCIAQLLL